jgi:aspartate/methionine/tyrosine aminotransferase
MLLDEFYSHFIYQETSGPGPGPVSGAAYVENVNEDPVLLVDGLTKSFRYPGWRVGWAVGPRSMIEILGRAASAIDGGPSRQLQRAMIEVLEPARADQECDALRAVFSRKRDLMISRLDEMGFVMPRRSDSTFYVWACLEGLPEPINDGESFFREALKRKVITVPGEFFDVNPGGARSGPSPFRQWMRFSFGPEESNMVQGLDRLVEMVGELR